MAHVHDQVATRGSQAKWWTSHFDDYDMFIQAGSAGELRRRRGLEQVGYWRKNLGHLADDAFWRERAVDQLLAAQPLAVPVMIVDGSSLGALKFGTDTGLYFRQQILRPFLARHLKDGAPAGDVAAVSAFETGTNTWRRLPSWPSGCASGCTVQQTPLYLREGLALRCEPPAAASQPFDEYV